MDSPRFDDLAREAAAAFMSVEQDEGGGAAVVAANLDGARRLRLPALTVPSEHGGMGANLLDFASYQGLIARADGSTALVLAMHHMLIGGEAEAGLWPRELWGELCSRAARGVLVNSAATEPGAGSPSQGGLPGTEARPAEATGGPEPVPGSRWLVDGRKAYTTGAPHLGLVRVSARVDPPSGDAYGARFLVELPSAGVTLEDSWRPAALAAAGNDDIVFSRAPARFLYREEGRGCEGTVWFMVAVAATYLGIGYAAYERVLDFTRGRVTAAGPVIERESVRLRLGRARAGLDVAHRNLLAVCAEWLPAAPAARQGMLPEFGLAKVNAVAAAVAASDEALRLAGAGGFGAGHPFARLALEARAGQSHPPVEDVAYLGLVARDLD